MPSIATLEKEASSLVNAAWATLGLPLNYPSIDEKADGVMDIEALILLTLLVMEKDRFITDLPAWMACCTSLINFQKLKTMVRGIPMRHKGPIIAKLSNRFFRSAPNRFKSAFGLEKDGSGGMDETVRSRMRKVNSIENIAQASLMIKNRLIYGTGFRADLITMTHIEKVGRKGADLAKLMCADNSTVSRILADLKAAHFLDEDGRRLGPFEPYPEMFMSTLSVLNLCEMIDSVQFSLKALERGALENLNLKDDAFGQRILEKLC